MSVLRFLAMLLLLVASVALATDATRVYWGEGQLLTPLSKHWSDLAPMSLASARRSVVVATHPLLWDWIIAPVLTLPAWFVFGSAALATGWYGRRRRRVNIFAN